MAPPDFASLLSSLGHEHAMQAACRIAKRRCPDTMKLVEVKRDELLPIAPLEIAQKSCPNAWFVISASFLCRANRRGDLERKLLEPFG